METTAILWLRNDLRLHDHPALHRALQTHQRVMAVYVWPKSTEVLPGVLKTGPYRMQFLREALHDLQNRLETLNIPMVCVDGPVQQVLPELCTQYGAQAVFAHHGYATEEQLEEEAVSKALEVPLELLHTGFLVLPEDLPFDAEKLPDIFTPFRKKTEQLGVFRDPLPAPITPAVAFDGEFPRYDSPSHRSDDRSAFPFEGGETAALARLHDYLWNTQNITRYKETRNGLVGTEYSSKFSPWLAAGCLSPRKIYQEIKAFEAEVLANESTYWLVFELLWRDYFRHVYLKYGARLFHRRGLSIHPPKKALRQNREVFKAWCEGRTGNAFVDANMRELKQTGFMSNRGRQNAASYLVHDLGIDWRWGASWFEFMLLDYDVFSNWGNWAYVAGVGNDPRENRYFDTEKQARMYDADGSFRSLWL